MATKFLRHSDELYHHGILGMHWGIRRYQNKDGTLTEAGKKRYLTNNGQLTDKGKKAFYNRHGILSKAGKKYYNITGDYGETAVDKIMEIRERDKVTSENAEYCASKLSRYGIKHKPNTNELYKDIAASDIKGNYWKTNSYNPNITYEVTVETKPEDVKKKIAYAKAYFSKNETSLRKRIADEYYNFYTQISNGNSKIMTKSEFAKNLQFYSIWTGKNGINEVRFMDNDLLYGHSIILYPRPDGSFTTSMEG